MNDFDDMLEMILPLIQTRFIDDWTKEYFDQAVSLDSVQDAKHAHPECETWFRIVFPTALRMWYAPGPRDWWCAIAYNQTGGHDNYHFYLFYDKEWIGEIVGSYREDESGIVRRKLTAMNYDLALHAIRNNDAAKKELGEELKGLTDL